MHWLNVLGSLLQFLSSRVGLGEGLAIIALTLLVRTALLPLSWSAAYRGLIRQKKISALQPELQRLKEKFGAQPRLYADQLVALYRRHGIAVTDTSSLLGALVQAPVLLGLYQALRKGVHGRFLWVRDLSKPDIGLAVLAGLATMLLSLINPDLPEHMRLILMMVPAVLTIIVALKVASALSLYWAASNCYSGIQTAALHRLVTSRIRSGGSDIPRRGR
jgi:YidC/Oxa1 family membrane protein insertase